LTFCENTQIAEKNTEPSKFSWNSTELQGKQASLCTRGPEKNTEPSKFSWNSTELQGTRPPEATRRILNLKTRGFAKLRWPQEAKKEQRTSRFGLNFSRIGLNFSRIGLDFSRIGLDFSRIGLNF